MASRSAYLVLWPFLERRRVHCLQNPNERENVLLHNLISLLQFEYVFRTVQADAITGHLIPHDTFAVGLFSGNPADCLFDFTLIDARFERCQLFFQILIVRGYIDMNIRAGTTFL